MRKAILFLMCVLAVGAAAFGAKVTFLGHACVTVTAANGTVVLVDPYPASITFPGLPTEADIVLVTHQQHFDHNAVDRVTGNPTVVWGLEPDGRVAAGEEVIQGIPIRKVPSDHGPYSGQPQGSNAIFVFTVDGIRFAHLGGVGVPLKPEQLAAIGQVDVVFMTAGGTYSLNPKKMIELLQGLPKPPAIVVPIHTRAPEVYFALLPLASFLSASPWPVKQLGAYEVELTPGTLPKATEVWVLDVKR